MTTQLICWAIGKHDSRDTASGILAFTLSPDCRLSAVAVAREIDGLGESAIVGETLRGYLVPQPHNRPVLTVAAGHGVTIVCPSGRTRNVRA